MKLSSEMPIIGAAGASSKCYLESISLCTMINKLCVTVVYSRLPHAQAFRLQVLEICRVGSMTCCAMSWIDGKITGEVAIGSIVSVCNLN